MKWINIDKAKKPKKMQDVLLFCERAFKNDLKIVKGCYQGKNDYFEWTSFEFHEDEEVNITHWMNLPNPPKNEGNKI